MADISCSRTSLVLASIVAVAIWLFFLLLALDIYGIHGWLRESRGWMERKPRLCANPRRNSRKSGAGIRF
ncbi:MAG: hypothetical protein ACRER2_16490 [Methylococcales bacterium]